MKLALSLVLIINSALPLSIQQRLGRSDGSTPIHLQAMREPVRLSAIQQGQSIDTWSRLRTLEPGTAITVTVQGSPPGRRYVVLADEASLIVLDLSYPGLPAAAVRILRDMATSHPEYFAAVQARVFVDRDLRVGPSGVFLADQRVADLGQVVERISRTDVETGASIIVTGQARALPKGAKIALGAGIGVAVCLVVPLCRYVVFCRGCN
jgi:hypothetical protein